MSRSNSKQVITYQNHERLFNRIENIDPDLQNDDYKLAISKARDCVAYDDKIFRFIEKILLINKIKNKNVEEYKRNMMDLFNESYLRLKNDNLLDRLANSLKIVTDHEALPEN